jgi:CubicO group peptidase (beta-lactamase class C family)
MASHMPWWEPGTASGYHLLTYGHLIGERVYLLTGLPLRDFAHQHIAQPLGADFQIGLRDADAERVADVIAPTLDFDPEALDHDTAAYRTFTGPAFTASAANTAAWRADLEAANGVARCPGSLTAASHTGAAGAARWQSSTWTAA